MQSNIDIHSLNVACRNLARAVDRGDACHCSLGCDMSCWAGKAPLCLPPLALSHSAGKEHAFFLYAPQPSCSLLQYFSIPISGTVGDRLLFTVLPATQVWLHVREQCHYVATITPSSELYHAKPVYSSTAQRNIVCISVYTCCRVLDICCVAIRCFCCVSHSMRQRGVKTSANTVQFSLENCCLTEFLCFFVIFTTQTLLCQTHPQITC